MVGVSVMVLDTTSGRLDLEVSKMTGVGLIQFWPEEEPRVELSQVHMYSVKATLWFVGQVPAKVPMSSRLIKLIDYGVDVWLEPYRDEFKTQLEIKLVGKHLLSCRDAFYALLKAWDLASFAAETSGDSK